MNKTGVYTIITFLITIIYVGAGMLGMSKLMEYRESQILSENGQVEVEEPVRTWHEVLEASLDENKAGMKDTEQVVDAFNNNNIEISLEPGEEYIDEDEAIETAKVWIDSMDISRLFTQGGWLGECSATLVTKVGDEEAGERTLNADPYYSYWLVEFVNSISNIRLYVNAGTNSVWNAQIVLLDTYINNDEDIQKYLEIAGTSMLDDFAEYTGIIMLEQESEYFEKMGIDTDAGNVSETVIEDCSGYAVTRIGYDSDIYAMMEISVISDEEEMLYPEYGTLSESHIMVSYSLQL